MSLTTEDLSQIRTIVHDGVREVVRQEVEYAFDSKLQPIIDKLTALENDVKEIYFMISRMQKSSISDQTFQKLSLENKLLKLNIELLAAAKQAGIKLPR